MKLAMLALASYLLGSIPFAYIFAKLFKGMDIRRVGSGNVGTVNVFKSVGIIPGALTGMADFGKGMLAVVLARFSSCDMPSAALLAILCAMIGHNWPIWLSFEGGGGLATFGGGLIMLSASSALLLLGLWGASYALTRHKYLSSVFTCFSIPVCLGIYEGSWTYFIFGFSMGLTLAFKQILAWVKYGRARVGEAG
ncbi:MAG: glycerol-3-phosphate acyltransferase [Firmicutes bacterium]|nr:glycerol-3-phosphate acyltransferase [Bacillota bacterium]